MGAVLRGRYSVLSPNGSDIVSIASDTGIVARSSADVNVVLSGDPAGGEVRRFARCGVCACVRAPDEPGRFLQPVPFYCSIIFRERR